MTAVPSRTRFRPYLGSVSESGTEMTSRAWTLPLRKLPFVPLLVL